MRRLITVLGMGAVAAVLYEELSKPAEERTWQGRAMGFIPYDLRPSTLFRLKEAFWNPEDPRIFPWRVYGIGWAVNFAALAERLRQM